MVSRLYYNKAVFKKKKERKRRVTKPEELNDYFKN